MTRRKGGYLGRGPSATNIASTGTWDLDQSRVEVANDRWPGLNSDDVHPASTTVAIEADDVRGTNIFVDKSGRSHIINTIGDITVSEIDKKTGYSSASLSGSNSCVYVPHSSDVHLSSDFTVEFYFKVFRLKGYQGLFSKQHDAGDARGIVLIFETNNRIYLNVGNSGTWTIALDTGFQPVVGQWYHIALMRKEDQWGVYIDGTLVARAVSVFGPTIGSGNQGMFLGRYPAFPSFNTGQDFGGYIDRFRITDGVARYMESFTPPSSAFPDSIANDPYYNNVELLLHMDGSNGSTTFVDSSKNNFSVVARSGATLTTSEKKFGSASGRFIRSSGNYIDMPGAGNALNLGLSDFTIEAWVNLNSFPGTGYPGAFWIFGAGSANSATGCDFYVETRQIKFNISDGNTSTLVGYHGFELNEWYHVAVIRKGYTFQMFVNGECIAVGYSTAVAATPVNGAVIAGAEPTGGNTSGNFDGWIDEVRITKGVARYINGGFTPPTKYIRSIPTKAGDPYFNNNALLLHMNGADGGSTFVDSSSNPGKVISNGGSLVVTQVGDARLSQTQSKFGGTSAFFDGTGDCLRLSNTNSNFVFGTGDFTIEAWVYTTTLSGYGAILAYANGSTTNSNYGFQMLRNGSTWQFEIISGTTQYGGTAGTVPINQWVHVAMVRSGNNLYAFADGQLIKTTSVTGLTPNQADGMILEIGQSYNGFYYWNGFIDDLRITKGVARYTSTFTPPTSANPTTAAGDAYFYNNVLLMPMNNVSGSHSFVDLSPGVPTLTAQKVFGISSAYFDGINGNIAIEYNPGFSLSTADFTVEGWFYFTNLNVSTRALISLGDGINGSGPIYAGWSIIYLGTDGSNQIQFRRYDGTDRPYTTTGLSLSANTWYHIAVCRINSILYIFVNGVAYYAAANTQSFDAVNTNPLRLGLGYYGPQTTYAGPRYWPGYMDEIRVTRGVGRYIPRFQPPLSRVGSDANTSLLLRMEGTNDGTVFTDSSPNALTVTAFGNARTRQAQFKFGASSGFFDGTGDYLTTPTSSLFAFGTGDFTIEMWIYRIGSGQQHLYEGRNGTTTNTILFYLDNDNSLKYYSNGAVRITTSAIPSANTWTHTALVRKNGIVSIFMNGILVGLASDTVNVAAPTTSVIIGANDVTTGSYFSGYIDDLRVSKGIARYDTSFTPPISQFLDYYRPTSDPYGPQVALLLRGEGRHGSPMTKDYSSHALAMVPTNTPINSKLYKKYGNSSLQFTPNTDWGVNPSPALTFSGYSGDFTIEFWLNLFQRATSTSGLWVICQASAASYTPILFHVNTSSSLLQVYASSTGSSWNLASAVNVTQLVRHKWTHIALCRSGGMVVAYVDGVAGAVMNFSTTALMTTSNPWYIGSGNSGTTYINGCIDDFRFTKGISRYLGSSFAPAAAAFDNPTVTLSEPMADKTVMLLHMNKETVSSKVTYDTGIYNLTPVMYGYAAISTDQSKFGSSSLYLDGTNSYIEVGYEYPMTIGTNDFTIEMWIYPTTVRTGVFFSDQYLGSGDTIPITIGLANGLDAASGTNIWFGYWNTSSWSGLVSSETVSASTWTHIAVNRKNGVLAIYKNGVLAGSTAFSTSLPLGNNIWLGRRWDTTTTQGAVYFPGYIDEFRFTNGAARYGFFAVPTTAFSSDANARLLINADGTDNSTVFVDESPSTLAITANGNARIRTAQSKFGGSSLYMDGTGDYLSIGTESSFNFLHNGSNWTVELWIKPDDYAATRTILDTAAGSSANVGIYIGLTTSRTVNIQIYRGVSSSFVLNATFAGVIPNDSAWHHIAITFDYSRTADNATLFIDGSMAGTLSKTANAPSTSNAYRQMWIGTFNGSTEFYLGYMDSIRVSNSIRYSSGFTPDSAAFSDPVITKSEIFADKVNLLMHMAGANNSTTFTDSSLRQLAITASGTAKISTDQSKFGGSSAYFDGTSNCFLQVASGSAFAFESSSFTIELWAYFTTIAGVQYFIDARNTSQTGTWAFIWQASTGLEWYNGTASTTRLWMPTLNTWHHIAMVRTSQSCQFYVDGQPTGLPFSDTANYTVSPTTSYIGARFSNTDRFTGYIDELRITREARYPLPFTPPGELPLP